MTNGDELEEKKRDVCPEGDPGDKFRHVIDLPFCHEEILLASHQREIRILCLAGLVLLHVDDNPIILEQGQDMYCSGIVKVHGLSKDPMSRICYRYFN